MKENETQEHLSSTSPEGHGDAEEGSDLAEEPDQRQQDRDRTCLPRNEKIRLIIQGLGLLGLLAGFLLFLFSGTVLPLFGTMVIVLLGYRRIDAWLDAAGRSRPAE
jgi:hypothetical protein